MKKSGFRDYKKKINKRLLLLSSIFTVSLALFAVFIWVASDIVLLSPPTQILLSWTDNSNDEDGFTVRVYSNAALTQLVGNYNVAPDVTSISIPINTFSPNTAYYFTVVAYNSGGQSPPSNTASITTPPPNQCSFVGQTRSCYTGPVGTSGVGICTSGIESCIDAGLNLVWNGVCTGQVLPSTEQCNAAGSGDFDCDGDSNCADSQCSLHPTCSSPSLTGYTIDGSPGSVLINNQPHILEISGSNINSNAVLYAGGMVIPSNLYSISPSGDSITLTIPALPTFIDPSVGIYVENINSPNPSTISNSLTVAFENPVPVINSISPPTITNPSNPSGYTTVTVSGPGTFVTTTDLLVTPPASSGSAPFLVSAFLGSPYVDPNTLQFIIPDSLLPGVYNFQAVVASAFGGTLSSQQFSLNLINPSSCPLDTPTPGCPIIESVLISNPGPNGEVSNNDGQIIITGQSEVGGSFNSNYILILNGGFLNLGTVSNGATLTANIPPTVLGGTYTISILNTFSGKTSNGFSINVYEETPSLISVGPSTFNVNSPISFSLDGVGFYSASYIELYDSLGNLIPSGVTGYVSSSKLTYSLTSGLTLPGLYSIKVVNPSGDGSNSISLNINPVCGDGLIHGSEICDDNNVNGGDGCSASCLVEVGWSCSGVPSVCLGACVPITYYLDVDGDGYGDSSNTFSFCQGSPAPQNYVSLSGDCRPLDSLSYPGASEICDGIDNSCEGIIDEGNVCPSLQYYCDSDGDSENGAMISGTCSSYLCIPSLCSQTPGTDCDDDNNLIFSGASEICSDGVDNNCNLQTDCSDSTCTLDPYCAGYSPLPTCAQCGEGILNLFCDRVECESGIEGCYWVDTGASGLGGSCSSCADAVGCSVYSLDQVSCSTNICGLNPSPLAGCAYNSESAQCVSASICGNGILESGEQCGETGATCSDNQQCNSCLCVPTFTCGNGILESGEACDDSNVNSGDGCSASCVIETSGSSGGGGGGSSSSGNNNPLPNSNLPTSNTNGGVVPNAPGISTTTPISSSEKEPLDNLKNWLAGNGEFRLAYWIVIFVLGGGIIVVFVLIVRTLRQRSRIINLMNSNKNIDFKSSNYPPSGYGGSGGYN